jgi:ATP-binding cassette subfamily B multidrug efflux pump
MDDFLVTVHTQMRLVTWLQLTNQCLNAFLILSTSGVALWLWSNSALGIGAVAATTAMALRLNGFAQWIMWEISSLFENIGTVQDGINTLTKPILIQDKAEAKPLKIAHSSIQFEHVRFAYNQDKAVLDDLCLSIQAGEKVGLVGRSGAGKSTLINLLLHFYEPQQGRILIDGQDIAHVTQDSLRAQIGMVTQDTSLLHRSVRDNILYGRPDASETDMVHAAEQAEADEFIASLTDPHGRTAYNAHVGERGVKLSGGQRQRIAIARVMLKDAPILLLDEATSALDSEVEAAIQNSLYKLMQGKTVIAIAHRLSTIAAMDRLIVMDQGRIVEQGSHQELLALNGIYAHLWAHQSGGFLMEEPNESTEPA